MPGGYGESDLYISFKKDEVWSKPRNLGEKVNTKGRDGFPFIDGNRLIFASNGREGLGGLDLYEIPFTGMEVVGMSQNLRLPFNSIGDDFGMITKGREGYFTSNREKVSKDDIYRFKLKNAEYVTLIGEIYDRNTDQPIEASDVIMKKEKQPSLYTRTDDKGIFRLSVPVSSAFNLTAGRFSYERMKPMAIETSTADTTYLGRIYLTPEEEYTGDSLPIPNLVTIHDDRIKPYEETEHFIDEFIHDDTIRSEIIYFALDSYELTDSYTAIMDNITNFLIEHVDVKAVLTSHTDSRSSKLYNKNLSEKRANEVVRYLEWMGVDLDRISSLAFGEKYLTNECGDDIECSEDQHQSNRRTEIFLVKTSDR